MKRSQIVSGASGLVAAAAWGAPRRARSAEPFRIGIVYSYTGAGPSAGPELDASIAAFFKRFGDRAGGRQVVVVRRDDGGLNPEVARRAAQELIVQERVDMIAGLIFTANAAAVGDISNQSKMPVMLLTAPTSGILTRYPYMTRWSFTTNELADVLGRWAAKTGYRSMYAITVDNQSGTDAVNGLSRALEQGGGKIIGQSAVPISAGEFASYLLRARDAKPDALFVFLPAGGISAQFLKEAATAGIMRSNIPILSTGDLVSENNLPQLSETALGITSAYHYSVAHGSALNRRYVQDVLDITHGSPSPSFTGVAMWDVLTAVYRILAQSNGAWDGDTAIAALAGYSAESPRGPIAIDAHTRDIVQNIYLRHVERRRDQLLNVEFATYPMVHAT